MKAVFFDRDGVINEDAGYLYKREDFIWTDGAKDTFAHLHNLGYAAFVVTNQSGVARGYYTEDDVNRLHRWMCEEVAEAGGKIEKVYYCPYLEGATVATYDRKSSWRKPEPGMILQAFADYDIDKEKSFLVGDSPRDIEAAERAGLDGYLFSGGSLKTFVDGILKERNVDGAI